jgi:acyl carrier protein
VSGHAPIARSGARPVSEADVRAVLDEALGDARLSRVDATKALLRAGVITSIELAGVLFALERRFGVAIPVSAAPQMSIASIRRALGGEDTTGPRDPEREPDPVQRRFHRAARRPVIFVGAIVLCLVVLDLAVRGLVHGPLAADYQAFVEGGRRFYPFSGAFSQDSFRFALRSHEISAAPPATAEPARELRVGVFGDCGTFGSFVPAAEAIPACLEAALRAQGTPAKVYNLAWYGRLLAKDYMLLELVWDRPLDFVVFTLSDDHLRRSATTAGIGLYRHVTLNWELLDRFKDRMPRGEQAPFRAVVGRLRRADLHDLGPLRRWEHEGLALAPYQPFLRTLATAWLPGPFASSLREDMTLPGEQRAALTDPEAPLPPALRPDDLDRAQLRMLASVVHLLQRRGVGVLLYVEPVAPREQRVDRVPSAASLTARLASETGSLFVDQSWALGRGDFTDSLAHFTPDANQRIGEALAQAIRSHR